MTIDIALTLGILALAIVLFIGEWIRADLTALLVLVILVFCGLVTPDESIQGFSNPAVVTIWAMFILSSGLSKTGVSPWIGRYIIKVSGKTERRLLAVLMTLTASSSAFIYSSGVTSVFLPITTSIARITRRPASRLLLPMAYGCLIGGMLTLIGTSSNLIVANFVEEAGYKPLEIFDFTPVGIIIFATIFLYMLLLGHKLLPSKRIPEPLSCDGRIRIPSAEIYGLKDRSGILTIENKSPLIGKTLAESRLGPALGLNVLRVRTNEGQRRIPEPNLILEAGDELLVLGPIDSNAKISLHPMLKVENDPLCKADFYSYDIVFIELDIDENSPFCSKMLSEMGQDEKMGLKILAVNRKGISFRRNLADFTFLPLDKLLAYTSKKQWALLDKKIGARLLKNNEIASHEIGKKLRSATIPDYSKFVGKTIKEIDFSRTLGISVLAATRITGEQVEINSDIILKKGDKLLIEGKSKILEILYGLQLLKINKDAPLELKELEDSHMGVVEVMFSPHTTLAGKTFKELRLREKYGVSVLAIWRGDRPYRTGLGDIPIKIGDTFLCYGPRESFELMANDRDFVVLEMNVHEKIRFNKAPIAVLIMIGVILAAVSGYFPIFVAAILGAVLMILTRCLSMEEAYKGIEWKVVFLIAAMFPLGLAMYKTGSASWIAQMLINVLGSMGNMAVFAGLLGLTMTINQIIPGAVNAVIMTPIALSTAENLELSPYPFVMGIAYGVASCFLTPISHASLLLVMSPGNYTFKDYFKNGMPILLIIFVLCLLFIPLFFPFIET